MGDAGQGGPVRLAILLASIAGLILVAFEANGGPEGASASHGTAAGHGVPGKIVALPSRRRLPLVVRRQIIPLRPSGAAAIKVAGSTYLIGGTRTSGGGSRAPVASVLRSVGGRRPTRVAKLPTAVTGAAAAVVGDRLYAIGGRMANGKATDEVQEYDIATEHSVIATRLPDPVSRASALTLDGFVYLLGGVRDGAPSTPILRFSPWRDSVARAGRMPVPTTGGATMATRSHRGYLVGTSIPGGTHLTFAITLRTPWVPASETRRCARGSNAQVGDRHRGRAGRYRPVSGRAGARYGC